MLSFRELVVRWFGVSCFCWPAPLEGVGTLDCSILLLVAGLGLGMGLLYGDTRPEGK